MSIVQYIEEKTHQTRILPVSPNAFDGQPPNRSVEIGQEDVVERGLAIYDSYLRRILEPEHAGKAVAIHIDSGDYVVGEYSGVAMRAMRKIHPTGKLLLHSIGVTADAGLESRMSGARVARS